MSKPFPVEVEIEGRKHRGQWTLNQGCKLSVSAFYYGSQTVDLGDAPTTTRAKEVLRDLVLAWQEERQPKPAPRLPVTENGPFPLTVIVDGRSWHGTWTLADGQVCVSSAYGSRSATVKRLTPETVAERLMKKLVEEWRDRP